MEGRDGEHRERRKPHSFRHRAPSVHQIPAEQRNPKVENEIQITHSIHPRSRGPPCPDDMKLEFDEKKLVREAIQAALTNERLEGIAREIIEERILCVTVKQAAKLVGVPVKRFRAMRIPVANLGEKTRRYKVSDIEKFLNGATSK